MTPLGSRDWRADAVHSTKGARADLDIDNLPLHLESLAVSGYDVLMEMFISDADGTDDDYPSCWPYQDSDTETEVDLWMPLEPVGGEIGQQGFYGDNLLNKLDLPSLSFDEPAGFSRQRGEHMSQAYFAQYRAPGHLKPPISPRPLVRQLRLAHSPEWATSGDIGALQLVSG